MSKLAFLFLSLTAMTLHAQGVWGSRAISRRFVVNGSRLYAAEGRGVGVYDTTNTTRLQAATRDAETLDLALIGTNGLVSLTTAGLDRWTIQSDGRVALTASVPRRGLTHVAASPTMVAASDASGVWLYTPALAQAGMLNIQGTINALVFHDGMLIVAVDNVALEFIDPSAPANPFVIAEPAKDLALVGDTLYVAGGTHGLVTIALDGTPRIVNRTDADGLTNLTRIAASGARVYGVENDHVIHVYDTTGRIATLDEPATAIAASGTTLFTSGLRIDASGLPTAPGSPLRVFDASQHLAAQIDESAGPVTGVALSPNGSIAYVVDRPYFRVLDVSQSAAPKQIASLRIDDIQDQIRINASGTRVVLYNRGVVQLVDVTNPRAPRLLTTWDSLGRPPSRADFLGDYILEANWMTGFHVLDFDHYATPAIIGSMKMDYHELAIKPGSDTVYLSAERSALAPVDLRDPHHPTNPTALNVWMQQGAFADANDDHADLLIVRSADGVHLLSLANPLAPVELNLLRMTDAGPMATSGQTLWLSNSDGVVAIDLTDAGQPSFGSASLAATAPQQVAAAGGKVVIADTYSVRAYGPDTAPLPSPRPAHPRAVRP